MNGKIHKNSYRRDLIRSRNIFENQMENLDLKMRFFLLALELEHVQVFF